MFSAGDIVPGREAQPAGADETLAVRGHRIGAAAAEAGAEAGAGAGAAAAATALMIGGRLEHDRIVERGALRRPPGAFLAVVHECSTVVSKLCLIVIESLHRV